MRMTLALVLPRSLAAGVSSGLRTLYFTIFLSIRVALICRLLELAVIAFLERIEEIGGGVLLAVVFNLLVAAHFDLGTILEREHIGGVLKVVFLHQYALECFGIEAEG